MGVKLTTQWHQSEVFLVTPRTSSDCRRRRPPDSLTDWYLYWRSSVYLFERCEPNL
jgi:hypothetical protein